MSRYLLETKATKRARNRIHAIRRQLQSAAPVDRSALERELRTLQRSVNDREMGDARAGAPEKRRLDRRPTEPVTPKAPDRTGAARRGSGAEALPHDAALHVWGVPRPGAGRLAPLPPFDDPLLRRAADIFSVPGLAHFMAVQIERQDTFSGFDALVSAWAPRYGALTLSDAFADCEIDLEVAAELERGERASADRLLDLAAGDAPEHPKACGRD